MHTADAREQMIEQQVRAWDVLDARVLEVMRRVPRELFVPSEQRYRAYADVEVPLARGQHMLRPSVAGRLLQALLPEAGEAVLQIGAGSGFVTACLRVMAQQVRALEIFPELADAARRNLAALGMRDVEVLDADALATDSGARRSEEHTSELQSQSNLVCRLLLENKKNQYVHSDCRCTTSHPSEYLRH